MRFVAKRYVLQQNSASEWTKKSLLAMNTLVQLLAVYTDPESNNAERYRQTDRRTDDLMMPVVCRAGQYDGLKG